MPGRVAVAVPPAERARRRLSSDRFVLRGDVAVDRVAPEVAGADRGRGREAVAELLKRGLVVLEAGDFKGRYERDAVDCLLEERNGVLDARGAAALRDLDERMGPREAVRERLAGRRVAVARRDDVRLGVLRLAELREVDRDRRAEDVERVLRRADERLEPARALEVALPAVARRAPRRPCPSAVVAASVPPMASTMASAIPLRTRLAAFIAVLLRQWNPYHPAQRTLSSIISPC